MKGAGRQPALVRGAKGIRALAAAFIRQLSLFDTSVDVPAGPPAKAVDETAAPHARQTVPAAAPSTPVIAQPAPPVAYPSALVEPAPAAMHAAIGRPGFDALCRGPYAHVQVELGPRLRDSWQVRWLRRREALSLRVPPALWEAPLEIKQAALQWAVLVSVRSRKEPARLAQRMERRRLEGVIRAHLERGGEEGMPGGKLRKQRLAGNRRRIERHNLLGAFHDLRLSLERVNAAYFGGALEARITWSARLGGLSTHRMSEDGEGRPYHLLTISRGYDCAEVTPEILDGVVYHECLHIAIPPRVEGGRRVVHGREFRLRERQYLHYQEWRRWHREGLPKSLRRLLRGR